MNADLIEYYGTDLSVVNAARVSFAKHTDELRAEDVKLIHYLAKHKHTSCFEHQGATLKLKVPIFIAHQIHRHRTFSYNEVSRRYVDDTPEFYWPETWRKRADNVKQGSSDEAITELLGYPTYDDPLGMQPLSVKDTQRIVGDTALQMYSLMLKNGVAPEQARMILPQNLYTEFYMSGNLRNWAHFLKLRLDPHAQKEVRDIAESIKGILLPLFPISVDALLCYD